MYRPKQCFDIFLGVFLLTPMIIREKIRFRTFLYFYTFSSMKDVVLKISIIKGEIGACCDFWQNQGKLFKYLCLESLLFQSKETNSKSLYYE